MSLVSEKRGKRVLGRFISLGIMLLVIVTPSISNQKSESEGVYYSKNEDITKGNSHYNNTGNVKTVGVAVRTGSISGTVNGPHETISVQDSVNSSSRGYSISLGIGIGPHTEKGKTVNSPYVSSVTVGYSKADVEQKITRNVAEFTSGSGMLDVKGKIVQVGSLIGGGFTLNGQGYEKQDLHDIDKSRKVGVNVTVYPNVTYTKRDEKGKAIYTDGRKENEQGAVYKVGVNYAETDKARDVLSTVGSNVQINQDITGVNRNPNKQAGEFEGREISPINVDLGTEYWLTRAGRGKAKDIFEDAGRSVEGIKRVLTHRDEDTGEYDFAGNVLSESITRRLIDRGFIAGKGKKIEQIAKEIESRYGDMTRKGIKVRFYGEEDVDTTNLTEDRLRKLEANGIATTGDGYIWINKEKIKDGDTIDFNKVVSHELTHQILGKDTEYEARYVEGTYGDHLQGIKNNGYLKDGQILDLMMSSLTDEDRARLNKYVDDDMQFSLESDKRALIEKQKKCQSFSCFQEIGKSIRSLEIYLEKYGVTNRVEKTKADKKKIESQKAKTEKDKKRIAELNKEIEKDHMLNLELSRKVYSRGNNKRDSEYNIADEKYVSYFRYLGGKEIDLNPEVKGYRVDQLAKSGNYYLVEEYLIKDSTKVDNTSARLYMGSRNLTREQVKNEIMKGNAVISQGLFFTGYGVTKELAEANLAMKNRLGISGIVDTGVGAVKVVGGGKAVVAGIGACSTGIGCSVGGMLALQGGVVAAAGVNNVITGTQKI